MNVNRREIAHMSIRQRAKALLQIEYALRQTRDNGSQTQCTAADLRMLQRTLLVARGTGKKAL